jgi:tetratricopeptide (TPR) repeat protein
VGLLVNTAVYSLAGSIAYARKELDTAIRHFDRAFEIDVTNCLAVWSSGLVQADKKDWAPASDRFSKATTCFAAAAKSARADLARLESSSLSPVVKARRTAAAQKRIDSAEELGGQSAFNAAQSFAQIGQKAQALTYVALAESQPSMREKALALRARIETMQ